LLWGLAANAVAQPSLQTTIRHLPGERERLKLSPGDRLEAGTCDLPGSVARGDTVLRLLNADGRQVAHNDDGCFGGLGSRLDYHVPADGGGIYSLVMDCYRGSTCGGTVAYRVTPSGVPEAPAVARVRSAARGIVSLADPGGAVLADLTIDAPIVDWLTFRIDAGPIGIAGSEGGGMLGGVGHLMLVVDLEGIAFGLGAGFGALGYREQGVSQTEAVVLGMRLRLGDLTGFRVAAELRGAVADGLRTHSFRAEATFPLGDVDLTLRGAGGDDGTLLGEVALVIWLDQAAHRPRFGISVHSGVGGVFFQPMCRFATPCRDARWVLGPLLGAGIEWRP